MARQLVTNNRTLSHRLIPIHFSTQIDVSTQRMCEMQTRRIKPKAPQVRHFPPPDYTPPILPPRLVRKLTSLLRDRDMTAACTLIARYFEGILLDHCTFDDTTPGSQKGRGKPAFRVRPVVPTTTLQAP